MPFAENNLGLWLWPTSYGLRKEAKAYKRNGDSADAGAEANAGIGAGSSTGTDAESWY